MAYYTVQDRTFEKGDKVYVVSCGNPDYEIEPGKQVISADAESTRGISARSRKIEEVVTEDGELRDEF